MRYDKEHKAETRSKIVKTAASRFRGEGIEAVGVASLMASAGLTHGGFYAHFASKDELVAEACGAGLTETEAKLRAQVDKAIPGKKLAKLVDLYLTERHRDEPELGCMIATLGPEIARYDPHAREPFNTALHRLVSLVEEALRADGGNPALAQGVMGTLVGSLILARTENDPVRSKEYLAQGRRAILALAQAATN